MPAQTGGQVPPGADRGTGAPACLGAVGAFEQPAGHVGEDRGMSGDHLMRIHSPEFQAMAERVLRV